MFWIQSVLPSLSRRLRLFHCRADGFASLPPVFVWAAVAIWASHVGCSATSHPTEPASLGFPVAATAMEARLADPGPIRFARVSAADWEVARSGLINLDHPRARAAELTDGSEPIEVFFYVLDHPRHGVFLVDSGVEERFESEARHPDVSALVASAMNTERLDVHVSLAAWLASRAGSLSGVFLTHLHLDHVMGVPDLPPATPLYVGPGEAESRDFLHLFTRGTITRMLSGAGPLRVWPFEVSETDLSRAVLDVFGDGSVWVLHVPGHTPGSTAFLVRSVDGPKLLVGDTSHTRWGWENGVEPGTFTADPVRNAESLAWLTELAARHPEIEVFLGHQR